MSEAEMRETIKTLRDAYRDAIGVPESEHQRRRMDAIAGHAEELSEAINRVRRLHDNEQRGLLAPGKWCPGCGETIPCRTIRALNGAL